MALHLDPPQAHTVNIEPMTATDWESESKDVKVVQVMS